MNTHNNDTTQNSSIRRRHRFTMTESSLLRGCPSLALLLLSLLFCRSEFLHSFGFVSNPSTPRRSTGPHRPFSFSPSTKKTRTTSSSSTACLRDHHPRSSSTSLNVWWFGGTEQSENNDDESCELVAVRIERPSSNSRRIMGEISIPGVSVDDVWSILTDYNRLSTHVPNLRESREVRPTGQKRQQQQQHRPGDGSYRCQLYQVGAQKIIGFDFSASLTMDMAERILSDSPSNARKINFKCVDSQFFSEFDGDWTIEEQRNPSSGETEVLCSYDVMVRPKGPVPVAALEWRIREDVPTNLRAVKAATLATMAGKKSSARMLSAAASTAAAPTNIGMAGRNANGSNAYPSRDVRRAVKRSRQLATVAGDWERGETMAKYLE